MLNVVYNTLMQPGQTINPGEQPSAPQSTAPAPSPVPPEVPSPPSPVKQQQPEAPDPLGSETSPSSNWQFNANDPAGDPENTFMPAADPVTWTASEFVSHEKNAGWYMLVVFGAIGLAAVIYLLTKDLVSPIVIVVVGITFAAFGARKPRVLDYAIDSRGVHIGNRTYPFNMFRTFSVVEEGAIRSILLMPMQRFNLPISVYYDPADEDKIVEALGSYLPHQDRQPAAIDNFMRKIRF
jgi:hypothetical protein